MMMRKSPNNIRCVIWALVECFFLFVFSDTNVYFIAYPGCNPYNAAINAWKGECSMGDDEEK